MTDIAKKELFEGDMVAFNPPNYKGLTKAKIIGFTPQKVKLEYFHQGRKEITRTEPFNVVKYE
jgi:hypothetical protein